MTLIEQRPPIRLTAKPEAVNLDIATTRPGTPGGIFMRQFWHAIDRGEDLPAGRAKPIRIMSEDYTLYRGASGRAQIVAQRCPHRGAPMHLGWVEDDDIRCVYHGWKFDCLRPVHRAAGRGGRLLPTRSASRPSRRASIWA